MPKEQTFSGAIEEKTVDITSLQENPRNPRNHPTEQITKLIASVGRFGQNRRVLVRKANMMIIAGHGLWGAMSAAGYDQVAVTIWDVDQKTADEYMLADNEHAKGAKDNDARIRAIIEEADPENYLSIGFDDDEAQALLTMPEETLVIEEIDTSQLADRFWISVRGPLQQQAAALDKIKEVMASLDDVEVELGTVAV